MIPKMVDVNGKKLKVGYIVAIEGYKGGWTFEVLRQTKKGNIAIQCTELGTYETICHPSHLRKLSVEELI